MAICLFERRVGRERDIEEQQNQESRNVRNKYQLINAVQDQERADLLKAVQMPADYNEAELLH